MRVLVIKTSSMGDVIHTLPALNDVTRVFPDIIFDWLVEPAMSEVPRWHPKVARVLATPLRRWRKNPLKTWCSQEWRQFKRALSLYQYDCIIDAQGLLKSAWLLRYTRGPSYGMDKKSAREPLAALFYDHPLPVAKGLHAVERLRILFARSLGYPVPTHRGSFGLDRQVFATSACCALEQPAIICLHGTTRVDKHWPDAYWRKLCRQLTQYGYTLYLPWGNATERARAEKIAAVSPRAFVLPKLNLKALAGVLAQAMAYVGVDTGLGHMAAALNVPGVSLYGSTSPKLVGTYGAGQCHLQASSCLKPCAQSSVEPQVFAPLMPEIVLQVLLPLLDERATNPGPTHQIKI